MIPTYLPRSAEASKVEQKRAILKGMLLALLLAAARWVALATDNSGVFWWPWGALIVLISFLDPLAGVGIVLGNIMVSMGDETPFGLSVGQLAGATVLARWFWDLGLKKFRMRLALRRSHLAFIWILAVVFLGSIQAPRPDDAIGYLNKLILIYATYLVAWSYFRYPKNILFLVAVVIFATALNAAWAAKDVGSVVSEEMRALGLLQQPNYTAVYAAVSLPLVVGMWIYLKNQWAAKVAPIILLTLVIAVIATASRGGLLLLGIAALLILLVWHDRGQIWLILIVFLVALLIAVLIIGDYSAFRYSQFMEQAQSGAIWQSARFQLIRLAVAIWQHYPWLGVGAGNWIYGAADVGKITQRVAHVVPAQILAETGTLGIIGYMAFIVLCVQDYLMSIKYMRRQQSPHLPLVQALFAATITMSFAWSSGNPYNQFWFLLLFMSGITLKLAMTDEKAAEMVIEKSGGKPARY